LGLPPGCHDEITSFTVHPAEAYVAGRTRQETNGAAATIANVSGAAKYRCLSSVPSKNRGEAPVLPSVLETPGYQTGYGNIRFRRMNLIYK